LALLTQPGIGGRSGTPTWTPFATALYVTTDHFLIDNPQHRPWLRGSGSPRASKTPNWSPWPCCKRCSDSPQRRDGCATRTADCAGCSLSAHTIGLQQAPPRGDRNAARGHRASGCVHLPVHRRRVGGRLDAGSGRSRETTKRSDLAGWAEYGKRVALALLLGTASAPGVRPVGAAGGIRADRR